MLGPVTGRSSRRCICGVALVLVALCVPAVAFADTVDQYQNSVSGGQVGIWGPSYSAGPESQAQVFTAGLSGQLDRVQLYLSGSGNSSPLTVEITSVSSQVPGSSVLASAQVQPGSVSSSPNWVYADFVPAPQVSAGTQYAIVVYAGGSDDYGWGSTDPRDYAGGIDFYDTANSPPQAADWSENGLSYLDQAFRTFVASPPALSAPSAPLSGTAGTLISAGSISVGLYEGVVPSGSITFEAFGPQPTEPTVCSGGTTVGSATVSADGTYGYFDGTYHPSAGFTPSQVGTYWWYATYSGDSNNAPAASQCGPPVQFLTKTVVGQASPSLGSVSAPGSGMAGSKIGASSISAALTGGASPGGTITFTVFGPLASAPSSCSSGGTTVGTATASGDNSYSPSAGFTPPSPGEYWWYASYGGDPNNTASSTCGASVTTTTVNPPPPPQNKSLPAISGTLTDGQTLKTTTGTWSSPQKLTYAYQWQRCTSTGTRCTNISGATHGSYKLASADTGHKITVRVTATDPEHHTGHATAKPVGLIKA